VFYAGFLLFAVVAFGVYQWLSAKTEQLTGRGAEPVGVSQKR